MLQNRCKDIKFSPNNQKKTQKKSQTWCFFFILLGLQYKNGIQKLHTVSNAISLFDDEITSCSRVINVCHLKAFQSICRCLLMGLGIRGFATFHQYWSGIEQCLFCNNMNRLAKIRTKYLHIFDLRVSFAENEEVW
jgi:hypothetical protein